jgi:hypothetical protein
VHHVRRLTATLVDILRHVATSDSKGIAGGDEPGVEGAALLAGADGVSEASFGALSVGTGTSGGRETVDSHVSAHTALLKAAYMPKPEYRGDEVRPFYADCTFDAGQTGASEDSEIEDVSAKADAKAKQQDGEHVQALSCFRVYFYSL